MKKFLNLAFAALLISSGMQAGRGGAVAGGFLGGMALGSMMGAAAADRGGYYDRPYYDRSYRYPYDYEEPFYDDENWDY